MNKIKQLTSYLLFSITLLFAGNVFAAVMSCPDVDPTTFPSNSYCLEGLVPGSYPYFDQGVKIKYKAKKKMGEGNFNLKVKYDRKSIDSQFLFLADLGIENIIDIDKTKYILKVKVRDGIATGTLKIKGVIRELGMTKKKTLMTANLKGEWALSEDGKLLGFNTMDIECNPILPVPCTTDEVIYLVLNDAITAETKRLRTTGRALTSVPLPAAVWLFGSGLLGFAVIARKRRRTI
jgi:hypothetical protein